MPFYWGHSYSRCSKTGLKMKGAVKYRFPLSIFRIYSFWKTKEQKQENFTEKLTFPWIHVQPPLCLSEKTNSIYGLSSYGTGGIKLWRWKGFSDFEQTHTATASTCQLFCQQDVIRERQMLKRFVLRWHLKRTGKSRSSFSLSKWRDGWHNHKTLPKGIFHYKNYQQSPQGKAKCEWLHSVAGGWELGMRTGTDLRAGEQQWAESQHCCPSSRKHQQLPWPATGSAKDL